MSVIRLTPHFSLDELVISEEASRRGLPNKPNEIARAHLERLAHTLERVRVVLKHNPVHITSGYRSPEVNRLVGGSAHSAHMSGLAADFICPDFGDPLQICHALELHLGELRIDQLIHEFGNWVHLGLGAGDPRLMTLTIDRHGARAGFAELALEGATV